MVDLGITLYGPIAGDPEVVFSVAKNLVRHDESDLSPCLGETREVDNARTLPTVDLDPIPAPDSVIVAKDDNQILVR